MIGPGWLPRYRPRGLAPLPRRVIRYARRAPRGPSSYGPMQLDKAAAEFPLATVRAREPRAQLLGLVGGLQRWLAARWQWLRPRSVPCAVAGLGMMAVLASADYLAHYKEDCVKTHAASAAHIEVAPR